MRVLRLRHVRVLGRSACRGPEPLDSDVLENVRSLPVVGLKSHVIPPRDHPALSIHATEPGHVIDITLTSVGHTGRHLKARGIVPHSAPDPHDDVRVRIYRDLGHAWSGFRQNVYPFTGQTVWTFAVVHLS